MEKIKTGVYVGRKYKANEGIRIVNMTQAATYWLNGISPLDIFPSRDNETGKPMMVAVFNASETKDLYQKWLEHKLK